MVTRLNRRDVARMILASTGILATTPFGMARAQTLGGTKVVVVGAGLAGLAAASSLKNQGADVIVLEAKPHIGGRLLTDWSMGAPFEVGAGWIHGPEDDNPAKQLADAVGASYVVTDDENAVYHHEDGEAFSEDDYEEMSDGWESVLEHIDAKYEDNDPRSLLKAIQNYDSALLDDPRVVWAFSAWTEFSKGGPIEDLSAVLFNADKAFDTPDVVVSSGYDKLLKPLAVGLDIRLSQPVEHISYDEDDGVRVTTAKDSFEADYCVCTVPLGVLKAKAIEFAPPLPKRHQHSIDTLGFGSVTKLALKFEEPFWDIETQYFGIITEPKGRWNYWLNYRTFTDENILLGLSVGAYAPVADQMTNAEMAEDGLSVLRQVWGEDVGTPSQILATHWATDPFTLGAYAYPRPGSKKSDFDGLARGLEDRLFLAGEHTIFDYAGTTHGAYMTGLRAAEAVIEEVE